MRLRRLEEFLFSLSVVCGLVGSQSDVDSSWWKKSSDPFGGGTATLPQSHDQRDNRQTAGTAEDARPAIQVADVVIPSGIFYLGNDTRPEDQYDASLNCRCVQFFQCDEKNNIITSGERIIDTRFEGGVWNVRQCPDTLMRCCQLPPGVTVPPHEPATPRRPPSCGRRRANALGSLVLRVQGGDMTEFGEFPWMLALLKVKEGSQTSCVFECGASLIHPQVALTAAHCVRRTKKEPNARYVVRAGEWDTSITDELLPHQDRAVAQVIVHEGFNTGTLFNDVALLVLAQPVDIEENVDTICLPEQNDHFDGSSCVATGWGRETFGANSSLQPVLRKVDLVVTPSAQCQEQLRKTKIGPRFRLHASFVCASGGTGQDTCKGDGGGPVACPSRQNPDVYVQVGVVSWGVGCGDTTPSVNANVAHQRLWIDSQLANLGFSTSTLESVPNVANIAHGQPVGRP